MLEEWRDIPSYSGYQVSDLGRVRSVDRTVLTLNGSRRYKGQLLRPGRKPSGHVSVALGKNNSQDVHVLVALTFIGPNPENLDVRHRDGVAGNNWLTNLRYGTRGENEQDKVFHSRNRMIASGHRFTPGDIQYIRSISGWGTGASLAREYGCSQTTIDYIRAYKTYRQVLCG